VRLRLRVPVALALLATAIAPRTLADPAPAADPSADGISMAADRLDIDVSGKTAVLDGHVRLGRKDLTVRCPHVEVRYDEGPRVTWAKGTGGVVAEVKGVRAEAPEVEIDLPKQTLSLRGGVRLARGAGWLRAGSASIHMASGKVSLTDVEGVIPVPAP
jgi:lipopolysaccharide export system protein LptA